MHITNVKIQTSAKPDIFSNKNSRNNQQYAAKIRSNIERVSLLYGKLFEYIKNYDEEITRKM